MIYAINKLAILLREFISEEHLCGGIARSQQVFQLVARIMPAAGRVDVSAGWFWTKGCAAVEGVTGGIDVRVVAATLLSHELEQLIG